MEFTNEDIMFLVVTLTLLFVVIMTSDSIDAYAPEFITEAMTNAKANVSYVSFMTYEYLVHNRLVNRLRVLYDESYSFMIHDRALVNELNEKRLGTDEFKLDNAYIKSRYKVPERFIYDLTKGVFGESALKLQRLHTILYTDTYGEPTSHEKYISDYYDGMQMLNLHDRNISTRMGDKVLKIIRKDKIDYVRSELQDLYSNGKSNAFNNARHNGNDGYDMNMYGTVSRLITNKFTDISKERMTGSASKDCSFILLSNAVEIKLLNDRNIKIGDIKSIVEYAVQFAYLFKFAEDFTRYYEDMYYGRSNSIADMDIEKSYKLFNEIYIKIASNPYYKRLDIEQHMAMVLMTVDTCYRYIVDN
jgi:hypothetical protein